MTLPVTVVIVNYNAGQSLIACLEALAMQTLPHAVQIVDNASRDGSTYLAHARYPDIPILPLRHNVGFARGVNVGVDRIASDDGILVTLNPDTVPQPEFLERLVAPFTEDERLGAAAATLVFATNPAVVASAGINVYRNGVALDRGLGKRVRHDDVNEPVFGASAGAAAYRLRAYRSTGGLCEPFFMYLEDVDLAWRLRIAGWHAIHVPAAVAAHEYSAASREGSSFKRKLLARNRIWTLARCLPTQFWQRDRQHILLFDILAAGHSFIRGDTASIGGRLAGVAGLPLRLRERSAIQSDASGRWRELDQWLLPPISPRRLLQLRALTSKLASGGAN